jgi:D-arginine dehydrogenase
MQIFDIAVIGAGIAGATAAYRLADRHKVIVLERESQPGYHTTGRSAALYIETYGNAAMRALTVASGPFFRAPPVAFAEHPLLPPRGVLFVGRADQTDALETLYAEGSSLTPKLRRLDTAEALALCPVLKPEHAVGAVLEPDSMDIDVHALHRGFLRHAKAQGAAIVQDAEVRTLDRRDGAWRIDTSAGEFAAGIIVNAAGAWCDEIAEKAGARRIGLQPMRRTAITLDPPAGVNVGAWPAVCAVDETWYLKPDAGRVLASPADETPMAPCDTQPDELDIVVTVDRIETVTTMNVRRLVSQWAGLRSFVADRTIVAGFDPDLEGFFWLAAQGGYGIQTSPAMGRVTAALIDTGNVPPDVRALGVLPDTLSPARLRRAA